MRQLGRKSHKAFKGEAPVEAESEAILVKCTLSFEVMLNACLYLHSRPKFLQWGMYPHVCTL